MDEVTRIEVLGSCLEVLHDQLPDKRSQEARLILETLGLPNDNDEEGKSVVGVSGINNGVGKAGGNGS